MEAQVRGYRGLHAEDVKAAIRKKFGTIKEFHRVYDLPKTGLQEILRGRSSQRTSDAVDEVLAEVEESKKLDSTADSVPQHLNAEAE
jgi:phage terminase small subunit